MYNKSKCIYYNTCPTFLLQIYSPFTADSSPAPKNPGLQAAERWPIPERWFDDANCYHRTAGYILLLDVYIYTHILFIDSIASDSIPAFLIEINSWLSSCFSKTWNFVTLYLAITAGKGHNNFSHISCRWLSIHFNRHSIWWFVRCYIVFYPHYILSNSASS